MTKTSLIPTLAIAAALSIFTGCQTTSQDSGASRFAKVDVNKDGKLSRAECSDYLITEIFTARDKNGDKKLTWQEWHVEGDGANKARFNACDVNKDGAVSLEEAQAHGRKQGIFKDAFNAADTNKDGYITLAEAQAYYGTKETPRH